jgi:predicted phage terminase large subunit-like protein
LQSWDTANKPTQLSDYSVCTTWGIKDKRLYLLHVLRKRLDYPGLKRAVREQWETFSATVVLIEDKASGTQLIQELIEDGIYAVTRYKPEGDKLMRLHAQTVTIENGFVYVPHDAHWLADYLPELTTFRGAKYDDQVDSTSQALAWLKQRVPGWGIQEYYRRQVETLRAPVQPAKIRVKPPSPISHVCPFDKPVLMANPDGTFDLPIEDAKPLLAAGWQPVGQAIS